MSASWCATGSSATQSGGSQCLTGVGRQVLIGGKKLVHPRAGIAALTPGEVGGEVFDMDLGRRPVGGKLVQGQARLVEDQDGLVAVGGQRDLADIPAVLVRFLAYHYQ